MELVAIDEVLWFNYKFSNSARHNFPRTVQPLLKTVQVYLDYISTLGISQCISSPSISQIKTTQCFPQSFSSFSFPQSRPLSSSLETTTSRPATAASPSPTLPLTRSSSRTRNTVSSTWTQANQRDGTASTLPNLNLSFGMTSTMLASLTGMDSFNVLILPLAMTCGRWVTAAAIAAIFYYFIMALRHIRRVPTRVEVNSLRLVHLKLDAGIFSWKQQAFREHAQASLPEIIGLFAASHSYRNVIHIVASCRFSSSILLSCIFLFRSYRMLTI